MNAMVIDGNTGFLSSPTDNFISTFSPDKKNKFIELADKISREQGIIPNINTLCDLISINKTSFYNHLKSDEVFKRAWNQCLLNVEAHLQTKMTEFAQRPGNYMDRITALRRIAPERWNPEYKVTATVDHHYVEGIADKAKAIEAEISDEKNP